MGVSGQGRDEAASPPASEARAEHTRAGSPEMRVPAGWLEPLRPLVVEPRGALRGRPPPRNDMVPFRHGKKAGC